MKLELHSFPKIMIKDCLLENQSKLNRLLHLGNSRTFYIYMDKYKSKEVELKDSISSKLSVSFFVLSLSLSLSLSLVFCCKSTFFISLLLPFYSYLKFLSVHILFSFFFIFLSFFFLFISSFSFLFCPIFLSV